jgi:hypothetical protein
MQRGEIPVSIMLQDIAVMTGSDNGEGRLVLWNDRLVAVLVRLMDEMYGEERGGWFLEAGFGPCNSVRPPVFADLDAAQVWVRGRLAAT